MIRLAFISSAALTLVACSDTPQTDTPPPAPVTQIESEGPTLPNIPASPTLPESNLEEVDFSDYSTGMAAGLGLVQGETRLETIDRIRLYFAPEPGTNIIKTASQTFEREDGSVLIFSRTGLPDDSVKAEEVYAIFSGPGGDVKFNQTLAAYGLRVKCYRGENTTDWQAQPCP